jgi:hypothetical protein
MNSEMTVILNPVACGEKCRKPDELVCRYLCGRSNNGYIKSADGVQAVRTAKLNGIGYELAGAGGRELRGDAQKINMAVGYREVRRVSADTVHRYHYNHNDPGAPARIKHASSTQIAVWPELSAWRGKTDREHYFTPVYLLWTRIDAAPVVT